MNYCRCNEVFLVPMHQQIALAPPAASAEKQTWPWSSNRTGLGEGEVGGEGLPALVRTARGQLLQSHRTSTRTASREWDLLRGVRSPGHHTLCLAAGRG